MKTVRLLVVMMGLLLGSVAVMGQESEGEPLGAVFESIVYGSESMGEVSPMQSQSLPGGGQGVATAGIQWWNFRIEALAISELQSAFSVYGISARVQNFSRNGVTKCTRSYFIGANAKTGNASVTQPCDVLEGPFGATWQNTTEHLFQGANGFVWNPSVYTAANP